MAGNDDRNWILAVLVCLTVSGCARTEIRPARPAISPRAVVVAPVLNLSGSSEWDVLKVTDMVASELQKVPGFTVIPVSRALAALSMRGKRGVESADDALELASEFDADATLVTAITEFQPFDPPRVGMIMQYYSAKGGDSAPQLDPVAASRKATEVRQVSGTGSDPRTPRQVQRVYHAGDRDVLHDVKEYDHHHKGYDSPYGWRVHIKSQELFVRYCCWATIRTMFSVPPERPSGSPQGVTDETER